MVLLNAGAALVAADVGTDLPDGIAAARNALETGMPRDLLARLRIEKARADEAAPADESASGATAASGAPA